MKQIFKIKILRQKFLGVAVTIFLVDILFMAVSYYQLREEWLSVFWRGADTVQHQIEQEINQEETLLNVQLSGIYSLPGLFRDMEHVMDSRSMEEYMQERLEESRQSSQAISSFPGYIKDYIRRYDSALYKIVLENSTGANMLKFDKEDIEFDFQVQKDNPEMQMDISQNIALTKVIYDTFLNHETTDQITFYYDIRKLVHLQEQPPQFLTIAVADVYGNYYMLKDGGEDTSARMQEILTQRNGTGTLEDGAFNKIHYLVLESSEYAYRLVTYTDDRTLLAVHAVELVRAGLIIFVISGLFLFMFFLNIRSDCSFVSHIFDSIESVNRGEFDENFNIGLKTYRANEYGYIAKELDDMCLKLKRYISREYQLKIRQQETEMRALQNQINPHFLYNTLEIIRSIALVNNDKEAADAMSSLGNLYRAIVKGSQECTIRDEVHLLQEYLKLMQVKSMGNFFYQIQMEPDMLELKTVKLWMQPLSENFFAHGFHSERVNVMVIEGKRCEGGYSFIMVDNGSGIPTEDIETVNRVLRQGSEKSGDGIGLNNVYMRLKYFYGDGLDMHLENNPEGGTKVCVFIPEEENDV